MKDYHRLVTDIKLVSVKDAPPFQSALEIYDGKVAYITFAPEKMIGVIIHDPYLYALHKYLFEALWERTPGFESRDTSHEVREEGNVPGKQQMMPEGPAPMEDERYGEDEYFTRL